MRDERRFVNIKPEKKSACMPRITREGKFNAPWLWSFKTDLSTSNLNLWESMSTSKKNLPAYWGSASGAGAPVTVATHMTWCCSDHSGRLVQCMVDCGVSSNFTQGWIARIHEEWAQICHHQISKKKSACMLRISEWRRRAGHGRQSHDLVLLGSLRKANSILEFQMRDLFGNLKATLDHQNPWGMSTGLSTSKKICLHAENRRVAPACRSRLPVTWAGAARITREGKFNVRWLWSFNWETSLETYKLVKSEKESQ